MQIIRARQLRPPGKYYGEAAGWLQQRIDAVPYRGKRIRLRAAVRAEVIGPGNQAHLWLRVNGKDFTPLFFDAMLDRPITASEWRDYEIVGEVPDHAETIEYGLALVGDGRAWLDAVSIQPLEQNSVLHEVPERNVRAQKQLGSRFWLAKLHQAPGDRR